MELLHIWCTLTSVYARSFHKVSHSEIVKLLCSLQNVFQTIPLALQTHLQAAREIVHDTSRFLYGDCPGPGCNCCLQVTDCLGVVFVHSVLQITPKVKIWGV